MAVVPAPPAAPLTIIYLHGFLSSPRSRKAMQLREFIQARQLPITVEVPALGDRPAAALAAAERSVAAAWARGAVGLVGSSLGGFWATVLAERFDLPAVLVNPSVAPQRRLTQFAGLQRNPYTGEQVALGAADAELLETAAPPTLQPSRYWLLVQCGDEVLDYREAVAHYRGARQTVEPGGDHQFQRFERHLPDLIKFLQCSPTGPSAPAATGAPQ